MKNKIKEIITESKHKTDHVRLDYRTYITLLHKSSLKTWLKRYPGARTIHFRISRYFRAGNSWNILLPPSKNRKCL
jgi:hypothetical protein